MFLEFSIIEILQNFSLHRYIHLMSMSTILKDKGKFQPRTCHEGLEREYRYNFTISLTLALYVDGW